MVPRVRADEPTRRAGTEARFMPRALGSHLPRSGRRDGVRLHTAWKRLTQIAHQATALSEGAEPLRCGAAGAVAPVMEVAVC